MQFDYLIDKIKAAPFKESPFRHLYVEEFFDAEQFKLITSSEEIALKHCRDDIELFSELFARNYKVISFPGCTTDYKEYIDKHTRGEPLNAHTACESTGIVLRLYPQSPSLIELNEFLASDDFNRAIAEKFDVEFESCDVDGGIQKYLDGYEISPHPDVRRKAATFMVNINPDSDSERHDHHTHYLRLKPEFTYVREFWKEHTDADRQWVPWDWCITETQQTKNNSIVLFSPDNDTMHGVKANYNHLNTQRTQLYGNLWYKTDPARYAPSWEKLAAKDFSVPAESNSKLSKHVKAARNVAKSVAKRVLPKDPNIGDRGY